MCPVNTGILEDLPDGRGRDLDTEDEQFAVDSAVSPRAVLTGQTQHQLADRSERWWLPSLFRTGDRRVPVGDQVAVPAQHGLRADQQPDVTRHVSGQPVQQRGEKRPISRGEADSFAVQVPFEDRELVPERKDFGVLVTVTHRQEP
jgi:hypothetical protein